MELGGEDAVECDVVVMLAFCNSFAWRGFRYRGNTKLDLWLDFVGSGVLGVEGGIVP